MKRMRLITDEDFGLEIKEMNNPTIRYASRGIVRFNDKIAILHKKQKNEYKLIGGGNEDNESFSSTFIRETKEETGAELDIDSIKLIGTIEEIRSQDSFKQISYIYIANVIKIGKPNYTKKENEEGAEVIWVSINDAMKLIKECENNLVPSKYENLYHTRFIVKRDYEILKYYQKMSENEE